jgi:phytoene synthase
MMSIIMGASTDSAIARACEMGVAMQLTNIARDVGEDARNGRLYLPRVWMREAGLDPDAFVASPVMSDALKSVIARLLAVADVLYARARSGVAYLPLACRPAILAAGLIYAEIGRALEALSHDSVSHRAHVPTSRKVQLLTKAVAATPWLSRGTVSEPLQAVAFLIEAVKQTPAPVAVKAAPQPRPFVKVESQFVRVLDIFERLERAEQMSKSR